MHGYLYHDFQVSSGQSSLNCRLTCIAWEEKQVAPNILTLLQEEEEQCQPGSLRIKMKNKETCQGQV